MRLRPNSAAFTLLLAGLAALPPLGVDMNLPALAQIGRALHAPPSQTGLTLSLFLAGYAVSQLLFGPLSDRFGRRGPLLAGCVLFTLGALGASLAPGITVLLAWRVVQGAGAGAGSVMAFAVVRDLFSGTAARVKLAYVNAVMNIAPMIGPTLGSLMLAAGWRPIFGIQAAGGVVLVLAVLTGFTESHPRPDLAALTPSRLARNYGRVLGHRAAVAYSLIAALSFGGLFSYVAGSPFVFIAVLGLTPRWFGLVFAATACGLMAGSFLGGRLASRGVPSARLLPAALCLSLLSVACLLTLATSHHFRVATAVPLLVVNMIACGVIVPTAVHGALEPFPATAGVASAVRGCLQMLTGAVASAMVAQLYRGTPVAMTLVMAVCAAASLIAWIVLLSPLLNLNARTT